MGIFDTVIDRAKKTRVSAQDTFDEEIRRSKLRQLQGAETEKVLLENEAKIADLEAKKAGSQEKKVSAEVGIMEKMMPTGMWTAFIELLKNRNPQEQMSVKDILELVSQVKEMTASSPEEQPSQGIYTVLNTLITNMGSQRIGPLELVEFMERMRALQGAGVPVKSNTEQFKDFLEIFEKMKALQSPPPQQGTMLSGPGGQMALDDAMKWTDHVLGMEQTRQDFEDKRANMKAVRENAPRAMDIIQEAIRNMRGEGGTGKGGKEVGSPNLPPNVVEGNCPECHLKFWVPASEDNTRVACPKCSGKLVEALEEQERKRKVKPAEKTGGPSMEPYVGER